MNALENLPVPEILWYSCDGMMVIDERRTVMAINPALEKMLGRSADQVVGKAECGVLFACQDLHGCPLMSRPSECPGLRAMERFEPVHSAEYTIQITEGKRIVVSASYTPIQMPGRPVWALVVMRDITLQKQREDRLVRKAMSDPLTSLPNREAFLKTFSVELKRAIRHGRSLGVAMLDVDGFKKYNDTYGHLAGDKLLRSIAVVLRSGRRASDVVARYGGDEFALLLSETDAAGAIVMAERLEYAISKFPFGVAGAREAVSPLPLVTVSIGVAVFPEDGNTIDKLLTQADQRLYEAKRLGCNRVVGSK